MRNVSFTPFIPSQYLVVFAVFRIRKIEGVPGQKP